MFTVYISLGSNLGDREQHLANAMTQLTGNHDIFVEVTSSVYETEPQGMISMHYFLNCVLKVKTSLSPQELLARIQNIEETMGRRRTTINAYTDRNIDIDILFYDDLIIKTDTLDIPHPRLHERFFVLIPLQEIAPGIVHPVNRLTPAQMMAAKGEAYWSVHKIKEPVWNG